MDEVFTWKEVSDSSLWHLYSAIQHGADGGMPFFYTTVWVWAKAFGTGVLALRLYSSVAVCAAFLVTWKIVRRFYGVWATAVGVGAFWGTSGLLLDQNMEARFYGLYLLTVALLVRIYARIAEQSAPDRRLLIYSGLAQAALVLTHVLGIIYGALILLALVMLDAIHRRFRPRVYLAQAAGWLALLLWAPAIRASMAAGRPKGWIAMPTIPSLFSAYLFEDLQQWLWIIHLHAHKSVEQIRHWTELIMLGPLAVILVYGLAKLVSMKERFVTSPRNAFVLVAYFLLAAPAVLFLLSHVVTPVFVHRYLLPSGIGLAIILSNLADTLGADDPGPRRLLWTTMVFLFAVSPLLATRALPPLELSPQYLDVQRLDHLVPDNIPVVAGWQEDFSKLMRLSDSPHGRYFFLLDWPTALDGPTGFVLDYHLMKAYRESGYYSLNIKDSKDFLCSHPDFLVLDADGRSWFNIAIKGQPQFQWKVVATFNTPDPARRLIAVHRLTPIPTCGSIP